MKTVHAKIAGVLFLPTISLLLGASPVTAAAGAVASNKGGMVLERHPEKNVSFTLGVGAGYLTGEATELVYWPDENNHKASELQWNIDNLFMVGVNASLQMGKWFRADFDGWFKATDGDGSMDDYDWQVPGLDWTDWSTHEDTDVTEGSIMDISAHFLFYRTSNVTMSFIGGYKQDKFGWEARGGEYLYSISGFRDASGSFTDGELGISYEQEMRTFYGGFGFFADFSGDFQLDGRIIYSPFVQGEAIDHHHLRNLVTYDDFEDGDLIALDLTGRWFFTHHLSLDLAFSFQKYDTMQGDSEWHFNDEGVVYDLDDYAGMDQTSIMFSSSVNYTF